MAQRRLLASFAEDRTGATTIEYGLIMALVFLAFVGAATAFGANFNGVMQAAADAINDAHAGGGDGDGGGDGG